MSILATDLGLYEIFFYKFLYYKSFSDMMMTRYSTNATTIIDNFLYLFDETKYF